MERGLHKAWARRSLAKLYPQLGEVEFEHDRYGQIGMTADALARFHQFGRNVVGFSGYNGRGIAPGTVFGRELAHLILGGKEEADMPLPVRTLCKLPFLRSREYYERGAQIAHLASARA
jgi:glycine/D-amino acid oxidase-like deaminating enzyme